MFTPGQKKSVHQKKDVTLPDKPIPLPSIIKDTRAWTDIHCNKIHYPTGPVQTIKYRSSHWYHWFTRNPPNSTSVTRQQVPPPSLICLAYESTLSIQKQTQPRREGAQQGRPKCNSWKHTLIIGLQEHNTFSPCPNQPRAGSEPSTHHQSCRHFFARAQKW